MLSGFKKINGLNNQQERFLNMENPQRLVKSYQFVPSKKDRLSIIIGMLLGDASIVKKYPRTIVLSCGEKYKEYFDYKCYLLKSFGYRMNKVRTMNSQINNKNYSGYIVDFTHDDFVWFYNKYYGGGKRKINFTFLRHLTPCGIAIWYMDDGNLVRSKDSKTQTNAFCINTQAFSYEENKLLQKWFKNKFGFDVRIHKDKNYFKLYFTAKCAKKFFDMIKPYTLNTMEYKLR